MFRFLSLIAAVALATPALGDSSGPLSVIDGDTFDVGGTRVRLFGVDAPEHDQTCTTADGGQWECGAWVIDQVAGQFAGAMADCTRVDTDRYGREVSRCTVNGQDLGAAVVGQGFATAYREYSWDYDLTEKQAQVAGVGIWSGTFQTPAEFRATQRPVADPAPEATDGCLIKGNISDSGQIYHMPGNRDYDATRINTARGERWFCSEADAQAAGWRPARN